MVVAESLLLKHQLLTPKRKLEEFRIYYNASRVHQSLGGRTPEQHSGKPVPPVLRLILTAGGSIAAAFSGYPSRLDHQSAMHKVQQTSNLTLARHGARYAVVRDINRMGARATGDDNAYVIGVDGNR